MDGQRTDPRLLKLILAVMGYVNVETQPKNPFVRGMGNLQNSRQAYDYLVKAVNECEDYFPEVEEFLQTLMISETD
jgi:hypothetical protein